MIPIFSMALSKSFQKFRVNALKHNYSLINEIFSGVYTVRLVCTKWFFLLSVPSFENLLSTHLIIVSRLGTSQRRSMLKRSLNVRCTSTTGFIVFHKCIIICKYTVNNTPLRHSDK